MNRIAKHMPCKLDAPAPMTIETRAWHGPLGYAISAEIRMESGETEMHVWIWSPERAGDLRAQIANEAAANYMAEKKDRTLLSYRVAAAVNERIRELAGNQ